MQQILSTSGSPCIPNPNKQAIQPQPSSGSDTTTNGQIESLLASSNDDIVVVSTTVADALTMSAITTTSSLSEKIGQIERLFLMGTDLKTEENQVFRLSCQYTHSTRSALVCKPARHLLRSRLKPRNKLVLPLGWCIQSALTKTKLNNDGVFVVINV